MGILAADPPVLIRAVEIPASGKVEVELPAGVPLFEVLRRPDGTIPVGRDGQVFHVGGLNYGLTGRKAVCVGCHAGHSMMSVPEDPAITNLAPSAVVTASSVRTEGGVSFRPVLLVDRRTDFFRLEWAAAKSDSQPSVRLAWSVPIHAREAVIYAPKNGSGVFGARTQRIREVTLRTFLEGELQESRRYPRMIQPGGTRLELAEAMAIDVLEVVIDSTSGSYEGGSAAALAEIEVIGKAAAGSTGDGLYVRGDANCDADLNVADVMSILGNLFLSTEALCCEAAADLNADGLVNITDPISLLGFLFRQGPAPPYPFPDCGRAAKSELGCDGGSCG